MSNTNKGWTCPLCGTYNPHGSTCTHCGTPKPGTHGTGHG